MTTKVYTPGSYTPAVGERVVIVEFRRRGDTKIFDENYGWVTACTTELVSISPCPPGADNDEAWTASFNRETVIVQPAPLPNVKASECLP